MAYCSGMIMKKIGVIFAALIIMLVSCKSDPDAIRQPPSGGVTVSQAQYDATMREVQQFITDLNNVIRNRDYPSYRAALSQARLNEISSQDFLQRVSQQPAMISQGITLKTAEDYFNHVVVPARANNRIDERVDDLEFINRNRVVAYTIDTNGRRLRLYDLEKIGNSWKITN